MERLLGDEVLDRLRGAQAALRLAESFGEVPLEAACRREVACDAIASKTVQRILHRGLDREPLPGEAVPAPAPRVAPAYARTFFDPSPPRPTRPPPKEGSSPFDELIGVVERLIGPIRAPKRCTSTTRRSGSEPI
jgi:hypothetical protein